MTLKKLTLPELLKNSCYKFSKNLSLNFVASGKKTYQDLYNEVVSIANHLLHLGVKKGDKVAILSANMPNWGITQFAIANIGAIAVPVLPGFCSTELQNILEHAEVKVIFVSRLLAKCLEGVKTPFLEHKILINNFSTIPEGCYQPEELDKLVPDISLNNTTPLPEVSIEEEDIASIIYTSGTTGFSKGVMLPYRALWSNIDFAKGVLGKTIKKGDNTISILPMAHMYGMSFEFLFEFLHGCHVFYLTRVPSPAIIAQAFKDVKPAIVIAVPLVIEKIIRKKVFPQIQNTKVKLLMKMPGVGKKVKKRICEQVYQAFGGNLYEVIIGGAALNQEIESFLKDIDFPFTVGYGATECAPIITYSDWHDFVPMSCGREVVHMEVKIDSENPETVPGEILARGLNVMLGYYKNDEATAQTIDKDGWYHTGDLGLMDKGGNVFIKGRSKNMLLGPNGQNIYPEEIEDKLNSMTFAMESVVVQRDGKLVGLVHPDFDEVQAMGLSRDDLQSLMEENRVQVNANLPVYCKIAAIEIHDEEFEKTPKKSIKRYLYK